MNAQTLFATQFLALAFFQNFSKHDFQLAWSGVLLLELFFYLLNVFERRDLRARRVIN
ncbi:MAG: hypothetical protein QW343_00910 [Candidatus Norongarragalinales archaeon]